MVLLLICFFPSVGQATRTFCCTFLYLTQRRNTVVLDRCTFFVPDTTMVVYF